MTAPLGSVSGPRSKTTSAGRSPNPLPRRSRKLPISLINWELSLIVRLLFGHIFTALIASVSASFRSRAALQLEILALRHQIGVLQRSVKRPKLTPADRLLWVWLATVWYDWKSRAFIMAAAYQHPAVTFPLGAPGAFVIGSLLVLGGPIS